MKLQKIVLSVKSIHLEHSKSLFESEWFFFFYNYCKAYWKQIVFFKNEEWKWEEKPAIIFFKFSIFGKKVEAIFQANFTLGRNGQTR